METDSDLAVEALLIRQGVELAQAALERGDRAEGRRELERIERRLRRLLAKLPEHPAAGLEPFRFRRIRRKA